MQIQGNVPKPAGPEARPSACPARPDRLPSGKRVQRYALMRNGQTKQGTFFEKNQGGQENTQKIREDRKTRCNTGQYTGEIIRGKGGREGNGHICYIIYTHGRRREQIQKKKKNPIIFSCSSVSPQLCKPQPSLFRRPKAHLHHK